MTLIGVSAAISTLISINGHRLNEAGNSSRELKSRNANHSVYTKFEDSTIETFTCTKKIRPQTIMINERLSVCNSIYVDKDVNKLSSYDSSVGINYGSYVKGRQFILVADETDVLDADLPAADDAYSGIKEVLFCGYNKPGGAIDINSVRLTHEWVGIEELLNEIKISGIYTYSVNDNSLVSGKKLSASRCIFNEDGNQDRSVKTEKDEIGGEKFFFNKSGIGQNAFWSCADILQYIKWWYCTYASPLIALDVGDKGLALIDYVSNYIHVDFPSMGETELPEINPMNLEIEGLGVLDAIKKVLKESKKYMLYKAYRCNGTVYVSYRSKVAVSTTGRLPSDNPILFRIGEQGSATASTNLINSGNINLNRETKNVGRVIVLGDYLRINSLCTTLAYSSFASNLSSTPDEYSPISGLTTFSDRLALVLTATNHIETFQQNYSVMPLNMLATDLSDLGANLYQYNGESASLKIFDGIKALEFSRELITGNAIVEGKKTRDMGSFVALPSLPYDYNGLDYIQALRIDGSNPYYYITPTESVQNSFIIKHDNNKNRSSLIVAEANGGKDNINEETGKTPFGEYEHTSIIPFFSIAINFFDGYDDSNPIPLFIRTNVRTDYRIKGIATISGYDKEIHSTEIVEDTDFKLTISYKDATYDGSGSFSNITNGFLNAADDSILVKIQAKAESLLDKYRVIQNSGFLEFNGYQVYIKVGDWSDKLSGTGRDINTPLIVSGVSFDFNKKTTIVSFGT